MPLVIEPVHVGGALLSPAETAAIAALVPAGGMLSAESGRVRRTGTTEAVHAARMSTPVRSPRLKPARVEPAAPMETAAMIKTASFRGTAEHDGDRADRRKKRYWSHVTALPLH